MAAATMAPKKDPARNKSTSSRNKSKGKRSSSKKGSKSRNASSAGRSTSSSKPGKTKAGSGDAASAVEASLLKAPFTTLYYFGWSAYETTLDVTLRFVKSRSFLFLVLPLTLAYVGSKVAFPELYKAPTQCGKTCPKGKMCTSVDFDGAVLFQIELIVLEVAWWILLGVLSSVGFGTGLHSGIMFLFPHIMKVVFASESCSLDGMQTMYLHPCKFECAKPLPPNTDSPATMFDLWLRVSLPVMAWGFGTAIGELPPYFISRTAARTQGVRDEEFEREVQESKKGTDAFSKMKIWTMNVAEKHGFFGVFLLASWPNAAFDMCGMCCGYLQMNFWTFFIATALGKGVVKVNAQAVFFIALFSKAFYNLLLTPVAAVVQPVLTALKDFLPPSVSKTDAKEFLAKQRKKIIAKFEMQGRFTFANATGGAAFLTKAQLGKLFKGFEGSDGITARVLAAYDENRDGKLSAGELESVISQTDGKFSLGSLDPEGDDGGLLKMAWDGFLAAVIIFFFVSIIHQMAESKMTEVAAAAKKKKK